MITLNWADYFPGKTPVAGAWNQLNKDFSGLLARLNLDGGAIRYIDSQNAATRLYPTTENSDTGAVLFRDLANTMRVSVSPKQLRIMES